MNILFIANLSTNIAAGLNWSVPAKVHAQEKIDTCMLLNLNDTFMEHWNIVECYHNLSEYGDRVSLKILPEPFNHPDIVIFEGFYHPKDPFFAMELKLKGIPYVIVPRGSLTKQALNNHARYKKIIAHLLIFNKYCHNAAGIQYLTEAEYNNSGDRWNKHSFILPNGFNTPVNKKTRFHDSIIKATFIGRLDMYHKGIDVLLQACDELQDLLRAKGFRLCFYGPQKYDYDLIKQTIDEKNISDFVTMGGEISGKDKENALLDSDLFVLTSRFEGHPMGLIEALAYGIPVVVTPGTNMLDEVKLADAGWCSDSLSLDNIKDTIKNAIMQRDLYSIKSKNAISLAKKYEWSSLAYSLHSELEKIVKNER